MATSKTGSFWLTEVITLPAAAAVGTRLQATIDLGAYVDVGDQQAIAVETVDFVHQAGTDFGGNVDGMVTGNGALTSQLMDLNPSSLFVRADDHTLIASGALNIDQTNNIATRDADFYPDNFGKLDESRMVVNDNLYFVAGVDSAAIGPNDVNVTVRIKARIVKLSTKDWMAIAIQSTAADN
jgi:hypothetical protein